MEFQFGTNRSRLSNISGGIIGQGLMMEGLFAFFLESPFLAVFIIRGAARLGQGAHRFSDLGGDRLDYLGVHYHGDRCRDAAAQQSAGHKETRTTLLYTPPDADFRRVLNKRKQTV